MLRFTMLADVWKNIENILTGIFAIIPQFIYFIYASVASLLDIFQLLIRKIAGLDVYYVQDPSTNVITEKSGDILKEFIEGIVGINNTYSSLTTVFWSMIIFGVIVLVLSSIFSIIKAHYNYDDKKSNPFEILKVALKSLFTMAITPIIVIFGVYLSEIFLQTMDSITSNKPSNTISSVFEKEALPNIKGQVINDNSKDGAGTGTTYYASYDMYFATEWTSSTTFSGMMFEIVASSSNRVRLNNYTATKTASNTGWDNCGIFYANTDYDRQEKVAYQIDYAFMNCLTLNNSQNINWSSGSESKTVIGSTLAYGPSAGFALGLKNVDVFSKYNVGLVWYYYNLWGVNYLLGFLGVLACLMLLTNIIFGLMKRLFLCVALFLIQAPIIGITPLDGGNGFKEWKKSFISYVVASFGSVIGLNLFFLIFPVLQSISFFNVSILDKIFNMLIIISGFVLIKKIIKMLSSFVGGADLNDEGGKTKKDAGEIAIKATKATFATVTAAVKIGAFAATGGGSVALAKGVAKRVSAKQMVKNGKAIDTKQAMDFLNKEEESRDSRSITIGIRGSTGSSPKLKKLADFGYRMANTKVARTVLGYMGAATGPIVENGDKEIDVTREDGTVIHLDEKETKTYRGKDRLSKGIKRKADISDTVFKAIGDASGLSKAFKNLEEKGVVDEGKTSIQSFFQAIGLKDVVKNMESGYSKLSTTKQLEKSSKKATKDQRASVVESNTNSKRLSNEIFTLTEKIKRIR